MGNNKNHTTLNGFDPSVRMPMSPFMPSSQEYVRQPIVHPNNRSFRTDSPNPCYQAANHPFIGNTRNNAHQSVKAHRVQHPARFPILSPSNVPGPPSLLVQFPTPTINNEMFPTNPPHSSLGHHHSSAMIQQRPHIALAPYNVTSAANGPSSFNNVPAQSVRSFYNTVPNTNVSSCTSTLNAPFPPPSPIKAVPTNLNFSIPPPNIVFPSRHHTPYPMMLEGRVPHTNFPSIQSTAESGCVPQNAFFIQQNFSAALPQVQCQSAYPPRQPAPFNVKVPPPINRLQFPPPVIKQDFVEEKTKINPSNPDEDLVKGFLARVQERKAKTVLSEKNKKCTMSMAQFRYSLQLALSLLIKLSTGQEALQNSLHSNEESWCKLLDHVKELKCQLSGVCSRLSREETFSNLLVKLKKLEQKREKIKARKERYNNLKKQKQEDCLMNHQKIDQFLQAVREKDLEKKREAEMKKEADGILLEVRKKIQEAKRTLEKLKIFQKLRHARKENAVKKGMFVRAKNDKIFEKKVSELKEVMLKQLAIYEAEERAMKVILETEHEDQLETEARWKLKQLRERQEEKCNNILQCLFGHSDPPSPKDPFYFFWQHYNGGNCDFNMLLKIRHDWDMFLVPRGDCADGSSIPQHWVIPEPPSSHEWSYILEDKINDE